MLATSAQSNFSVVASKSSGGVPLPPLPSRSSGRVPQPSLASQPSVITSTIAVQLLKPHGMEAPPTGSPSFAAPDSRALCDRAASPPTDFSFGAPESRAIFGGAAPPSFRFGACQSSVILGESAPSPIDSSFRTRKSKSKFGEAAPPTGFSFGAPESRILFGRLLPPAPPSTLASLPPASPVSTLASLPPPPPPPPPPSCSASLSSATGALFSLPQPLEMVAAPTPASLTGSSSFGAIRSNEGPRSPFYDCHSLLFEDSQLEPIASACSVFKSVQEEDLLASSEFKHFRSPQYSPLSPLLAPPSAQEIPTYVKQSQLRRHLADAEIVSSSIEKKKEKKKKNRNWHEELMLAGDVKKTRVHLLDSALSVNLVDLLEAPQESKEELAQTHSKVGAGFSVSSIRARGKQIDLSEVNKLLDCQYESGCWNLGKQLDELIGIDSDKCEHILAQSGLASLGKTAAEHIKQELATILVLFALMEWLWPELFPLNVESFPKLSKALLQVDELHALLDIKLQETSMTNINIRRLKDALTKSLDFCKKMDSLHPVVYSTLELGKSWLNVAANLMQPVA